MLMLALSIARPIVRGLDHPIEWAKDVATVATGGAATGAWLLDYVHGIEGVIISGLTIVVLALRVRRYLRDDRRVSDKSP